MRLDHEVGQLLVGLDLVKVLADVAGLLLSIEVLRRLSAGLIALDDALQAVLVLHQHLLMVGLALDGVPRTHEPRHLLEDLQLVPQLGVFHYQEMRPQEGDVLQLFRVAPISNFLLRVPFASTPAVTDQRPKAIIAESQLFYVKRVVP